MIGKTPRKKEVEVEVESERRRIGAVRRAIGRIFNATSNLSSYLFGHLQLVEEAAERRSELVFFISSPGEPHTLSLPGEVGRRIRHLVRRRNRRLLLL